MLLTPQKIRKKNMIVLLKKLRRSVEAVNLRLSVPGQDMSVHSSNTFETRVALRRTQILPYVCDTSRQSMQIVIGIQLLGAIVYGLSDQQYIGQNNNGLIHIQTHTSQ